VKEPKISVEEARKIIGVDSKDMSDEDVETLISNLSVMARASLEQASQNKEVLTEKIKNIKPLISNSVRASGASLMDPGVAASFGVNNYLEKYIDGYLLCDLESIAYDISPKKHPGAAGYPLILTICSGMELLGALLRPKIGEKYDEELGIKYFGHYWKHYLSKINPEYDKYGDAARSLVRNGLAHLYMAKPRIGVVKSNSKYHLKQLDDHLVFDAVMLYEDFKKSYLEIAKPILLDGKDGSILASNRLNNILAKYMLESDEKLSKLLGELDNKSGDTTTVPPTIS
jgi:hypothetical protein